MKILSHRGYWQTAGEQNTALAFGRSFRLEIGAEVDLRDHRGGLVVSHDVPTDACLPFSQLLELHQSIAPRAPLALNIKADGLQRLITQAIRPFPALRFFVFDMSGPETIRYAVEKIPFFARQSELEAQPMLYDVAKGIWLDAISSDWYDDRLLQQHHQSGKDICIVSSELHGRDRGPLWNRLRALKGLDRERLLLCTDFPEEARAFFNE